eukprot:TRINITY_DN33005_c0_g1_i1.p1 TRINITY_DN33005_c0_g1~~TRINITY_DN33005_c0_g1_i1.p1  ORF type:complete len:328 (+),score=92.28 TRINITY_DN33005_c0_g1_i1:99-1082(+)
MLRRCVLLQYKQVVSPTFDQARTPNETRFWGLVGANHSCQLTSYNTGDTFEEAPVVESVLVGCGVDEDASGRDLVFALKKDSATEINVKTGSMCSLMYGAANPQVHHFFKQLGVRCWTATVTGRGVAVPGDEGGGELWTRQFAKHQFLLGAAAQRNRAAMKKWDDPLVQRAPGTTDEEEDGDDDVVNNAGDYSLWRLKPENGYLGVPSGSLDKVSVMTVPQLDPLGGVVQRWVTRFNFRRDILIEGIRTAYSVPLKNAFCFHIDAAGLYVMGTTEADPAWQEYFLEWGPSMKFDETRQVKSWWAEFVRQTQLAVDDVESDKPEELTK